MSGKVARRLRKIAEAQRTVINAYLNYYRGLKALYKQGKFILT